MRTAQVLLIALIAGSTGCVVIHEQKLPAYDLATKTACAARPRLFFAEQVDPQMLPVLCPFLSLEASSRDFANESIKRDLWEKAVEYKADVIVTYDAGPQYAGSIATYWGFGISTSQPLYAYTVRAICYRICPARLGVQTDESGMVTVIAPESDLRKAGLLEGDKLLSINGMGFTPGPAITSAHWIQLLKLQVGDEVNLVWIRPGAGRMEGIVKAYPNGPMPIPLADSLEWKDPPPPRQPTEFTPD